MWHELNLVQTTISLFLNTTASLRAVSQLNYLQVNALDTAAAVEERLKQLRPQPPCGFKG